MKSASGQHSSGNAGERSESRCVYGALATSTITLLEIFDIRAPGAGRDIVQAPSIFVQSCRETGQGNRIFVWVAAALHACEPPRVWWRLGLLGSRHRKRRMLTIVGCLELGRRDQVQADVDLDRA